MDRLSLSVADGESIAVFGPNGAGKTTLVRLLTLGLRPGSGRFAITGLDPRRDDLEIRRRIGVVSHRSYLYDGLTARQNLDLIAEFNGIDTAESRRISDDLLKKVGLMDVADKPVGTYSKGMKQRLGIADVLVKRPSVVILDEPTSGLDPAGINEVLDLIQDLPHLRQGEGAAGPRAAEEETVVALMGAGVGQKNVY